MKSLWELYLTFARIGCVTFGGGYAMLPILERELVDKRHWTTMDDLRDYFSIGQCTPGVIALNVSTFIGEKRAGVKGALAKLLGFLTGPLVIITLIAAFVIFKHRANIGRPLSGTESKIYLFRGQGS